MSGEMHMRRRNEVFGCIPHARGASPSVSAGRDTYVTCRVGEMMLEAERFVDGLGEL